MSGAATDPYKVWIDDWQAGLEGEAHHLPAAADEMALDLQLKPEKPPVIHGENGVSKRRQWAMPAITTLLPGSPPQGG